MFRGTELLNTMDKWSSFCFSLSLFFSHSHPPLSTHIFEKDDSCFKTVRMEASVAYFLKVDETVFLFEGCAREESILSSFHWQNLFPYDCMTKGPSSYWLLAGGHPELLDASWSIFLRHTVWVVYYTDSFFKVTRWNSLVETDRQTDTHTHTHTHKANTLPCNGISTLLSYFFG